MSSIATEVPSHPADPSSLEATAFDAAETVRDSMQGLIGDAAAQVPVPRTWHRWPWWARGLHVFFIVNLLAQMGYASWQVFVVLQPEGVVGPMFSAAHALPFEEMMIRRMYAIEGWIAFGILSIYLGVTELLPRTRTSS